MTPRARRSRSRGDESARSRDTKRSTRAVSARAPTHSARLAPACSVARGVGFDGGDPGAAEFGDRGGEQADAAVQVEVPGLGIQHRVVAIGIAAHRIAHRRADGRVEGLRCQAVHLPESARVHAELPRADALDHRLARFAGSGLRRVGSRDDPHAPVGGLDEVDAPGPALQTLQRRPLHGGRRERIVLDRDHDVAARGERPDRAVGVDVEAHPRAPARAVRALALAAPSPARQG